MSGDRSVRGLVKAGVQRLGFEDEARTLSVRARRRLEPAAVRQNRREDELIRLLAASVLAEDADCIDVGANVGAILQTLVDLAPAGRHLAYEPVPALADDLRARFPGVEVRNAALADEAGETEFVVHRELMSRSSLRSVGYGEDETERIAVRVERLDDALPAGFVPRLLKVDVEGAEHLVFAGAQQTLREHQPLVLFEHQRSTAGHYGVGSDDVFAALCDGAGLRIFDMQGGGPYSRASFREVYEAGSRWNFFAARRSFG